MDPTQLPSPPQESTDIFSLSDQVLSDKLQFIEEIGYGNWGSVWLCRPKSSSSSPQKNEIPEQKIAVKLVHRSKTSTTAARVRSLWNEMKIVRAFKTDPHPSIVPFHSFIITPSYALITMPFLPTLVPVEVDESKARDWFRFLLSGVEFLHKRGVVHNDIKPANILLSHKNVPVLVDFGFAEKYDLESPVAFHSNLSYGTPEYLSPERARGMPHDTRKSDIWSVGISFFEILTGRTPFEYSDGEQFTSKEDLEKYWARTLRGKWVGSWKMSKGIESLLQRMIAPNADLRCTASQAMADIYWHPRKESQTAHRRSSSYNSSIVFEKDMTKLLNMTPSSRKDQDYVDTPPGLDRFSILKDDNQKARPTISKSRSQPKVAATKIQPRKRVPVPPIIDLSPIKASPPSSPLSSATAKENILTFNKLAEKATAARRPRVLAPRDNLPHLAVKASAPDVNRTKRKGKVLGDMTCARRNDENMQAAKADVGVTLNLSGIGKESTSARDRMREWEREKERLKEMEKLEEFERERDEQIVRDKEQKRKSRKEKEKLKEGNKEKPKEEDKENAVPTAKLPSPGLLPSPRLTPPLTDVLNAIPDTPLQVAKESTRNIFKHSIKRSIDKTMQLYKTSTLAQVTGRTTPARSLSVEISREIDLPRPNSAKESCSDEGAHREANSSLPVVRQAIQTERVAADAHTDRMTIWMRNVEKVVEDAQMAFAACATHDTPLPPLPVAPVSRIPSQNRSHRASRLPRKVLAASQIFADENAKLADASMATSHPPSAYPSAKNSTSQVTASSDDVLDGPSQLDIPEVHTPSRRRRATVSTRSPEPGDLIVPRIEIDLSESPSKHKAKSKSHTNLLQLHIAPISVLEEQLNKPSVPEPSPRLSQVLDRSLFIAPPFTSRENLGEFQDSVLVSDPSLDDLTSSPCHVEPYPPRPWTQNIPVPDTPSQRRLEGVYDRFLMATSGVKRLGKGYQSDNAGPMSNSLGVSNNHVPSKRESRVFYTARRPMPPPVSSEDQRRTASVDELGVITFAAGTAGSGAGKDENSTTVALVRRAFKAIVPGSRRLSRLPA